MDLIPPAYQRHLWALVLFCCTLVLWPSTQNNWVNWDDQDYVLENALVHTLSVDNLKEIFMSPQFQGAYTPLALVSWSIDYQLWGDNASGFHLTNLLLHLANVFLVYWFILLLSWSHKLSALTAFLFGIHPMHIESVAWISARKDVLYTFFLLAALIAYVKYVKRAERKYNLLCLGCFLFSLLAKGMAVVLPLLLLFIDYLLHRPVKKKIIVEKIPYFIIALAFGSLAIYAQQHGKALTEIRDILFMDSFFVASYGLIIYLIKFFIPFRLSAFHPYPNLPDEAYPWFIYASIIPFILLGIWVLKEVKRSREFAFCFGFFLIAIGPVLQFLPIGAFIYAERFSYVAYIGLSYGISLWVLSSKKDPKMHVKPNRNIVRFALCLYLLILSVISFQRSQIWKNGESLWTDVIEKYPDHFFAYGNRASYYISRGDMDAAYADLNKSIALNSRFPETHNNRGIILMQRRDYAQARQDFEQALALDPNLYEAHLNLGVIYMNQGQHESALASLNKAIKLGPTQALAWYNRGFLYGMIGQLGHAIDDLSQAITLNNKNPIFYKDRAMALHLAQAYETAISNYTSAILLAPTYAEAYLGRAHSYKAILEFGKASEDAVKAKSLGISVPDSFIQQLKTN